MKKRFIFLPLLLICSVLSCSSTYFKRTVDNVFRAEEEDENEENIVDKKLVIKHMYFDEPGDCTLIQFGGKNILIDTGPYSRSFSNDLNDLGVGPKDKLDYVIITHQDDDHTGNFKEVFKHSIGTLIDFDSYMDTTIDKEVRNIFNDEDYYISKTIKGNYRHKKRLKISSGKIEKYIPSSLCMYKDRFVEKKDAIDAYKLINKKASDEEAALFAKSPNVLTIENGDQKLTLRILHNEFAYKVMDHYKSAPNVAKNNMSVCVLLDYDKQRYLFTGDLMEFNTSNLKDDDITVTDDSSDNDPLKPYERVYGETKLVNNNLKYLKDGVLYFRGGHHGSNSSNSQYFLSVIRPQYVFWSTGGQYSGYPHYNFPTNSALINVGRYTDRIFVSSIDNEIIDIQNDKGVSPYYGQTTFTYNPDEDEKINVQYSGPAITDSIFLSPFFQNPDLRKVVFNNRGDSTKRSKFLSREYPLHIFNLTTSKVLPDKPIDCTYIKIGHLDIIIGAGSFSKNEEKNEIISKIKYLCNDKEIDYIIIPTTRFESYSFLIGSGGLFSQKDLSIKNIIYRDVDVLKEDFEKELTSTESSGTNLMPLSQILTNEIILPLSSNEILNEENNLKLNFLNTKHKYDKVPEDGNSWETYSIVTLLTVDDFSYLHLGSDVTFGYDKESGINYLLSHNKELLLDNVDVLQMPHYGAMYDANEFISPFYNFVSKVSSAKPNNRYSYSKGSFAVLMNTTMYSIIKDEQIIHKYPANLTIEKKDEDGNNIGCGLKYRKNNEEKKLLLFSTLKTDSGKSKTLPFASNSINGDLCMRVTIQHNARIENDQYFFYTKVTYGVNRNYANKVGELLFSEIYNNDGSGVNFKYENKAYGDDENIMVSDEDFGY